MTSKLQSIIENWLENLPLDSSYRQVCKSCIPELEKEIVEHFQPDRALTLEEKNFVECAEILFKPDETTPKTPDIAD